MEKKLDVKLNIKTMTVEELENRISSMNENELRQASSMIRLLRDKITRRQSDMKAMRSKHS